MDDIREGHGNGTSRAMTLLRSLSTSPWVGRSRFASWTGVTFGGRRDTYESLGYERVITPRMYRARYERGGIAGRIVDAFPKACWRGGGGIYEDEDPEVETTFEKEWKALNQRLHIWQVFLRADQLAGLGRYAIVLIGAPGALDTPLESVKGPDDIKYLMPYAEDDAKIAAYEQDDQNERWGRPTEYSLGRSFISTPGQMNPPVTPAKPVHWTRVIHIADNALDDLIFGQPRLKRPWNLLDDLDKVIGGGAEAFWKRADGGTQYKLDPEMQFDPDPTKAEAQKAKMREEFDEFTHELRRNLITRGVEINRMGSDTANIAGPAAAVMDQIAAATGIPQRILMGSEMGELASTRDKSNWDDQVQDRRDAFCEPMVARQMLDRFIDLGVLPEPEQYEVEWPEIEEMDQGQRVAAAAQVATINQTAGEVVVMPAEIRTVYLGLAPMTPEQEAEVAQKKAEADAQAQAIAQGQGPDGQGGPPQDQKERPPTEPDDSKAQETKQKPFKAAQAYDDLVEALVDDDLPTAREILRTLGGAGSGNFGHAGRPGEVGGAGAGGGKKDHTIKKSEDFSYDGLWHVTFDDGRQYGIYKDQSSATGEWQVESLPNAVGLGAAFTKKEMIEKIRTIDESKPYIDVQSGRHTGKTIGDALQPYRAKFKTLGSAKSGNYGHKGRPGEVGGSSSEGGPEDLARQTPIKVDKVKDAIPLILAGKVVELKNPEKVHTLMTRLAEIAKDAEKKGEKAPQYDACQVVVKGSSFFCGQHLVTKEYPHGMPRIDMPQFAGVPEKGSKADKLPRDDKGNVDGGPEFLEYLTRKGIGSESVEVRSDSLAPTQNQLDGPKIAKRMAKKNWKESSPIFISRDGYVVDGHHRWAADVGRDAKDGKLGDSKIRAIKIDAPISEILHIANKWTKSFGLTRKAVAPARAAEEQLELFVLDWHDGFNDAPSAS